jgi:hypothetical protein
MKRSASILVVFCATLLASAILACGGKTPSLPPSSPGGPIPGQSTTVVPLLSSSANGQLLDYLLTVDSISLTSQAGATVSLFSTPQYVEFIGLNGAALPLPPLSIPQAVYTSATVQYSNASFICPTAAPGSFGTYTTAPVNGTATVTLASPITVAAADIALGFNLNVSNSMSLSNGCTPPTTASTITPTFNLSALSIAKTPTSNLNGLETGINGQVLAVTTASNTFTLVTNDGSQGSANGTGSPLTVAVDSSTVYQGISGISALAANMFVDMDANLQSNGSLLATRISVADPTALNTSIGIVLGTQTPGLTSGILTVVARQEQGAELSAQPQRPTLTYSWNSGTTFQVSGQFTNPQSLPYYAPFSGATLLGGQTVAVSSPSIPATGHPLAAAVTLIPQTINGTVTAVFPSGGPYTGYDVKLAVYDPISLYDSSANATVAVYTTSDTRILTSGISTGSVIRATGLLFANGTAINMACSQIDTGVTE